MWMKKGNGKKLKISKQETEGKQRCLDVSGCREQVISCH
jgi:hypothetical protein